MGRPYLRTEPVRGNLIRSILSSRIEHPEPGRYWILKRDGVIEGLAIQSPVDYFGSISPCGREAAISLADYIFEQGITIPGMGGEPATVAAFAGQWAERTSLPALPDWSGRIYEFEPGEQVPTRCEGESSPVTEGEIDKLVEWLTDFRALVRSPAADARPLAQRMQSQGRMFFWHDDNPRTMVGFSLPVDGVARIGPVYTPPEFRNRGYATACTQAVTRNLYSRGHRCILYTDLDNPTSNSIYRAIGYRVAAEFIRYKFGADISEFLGAKEFPTPRVL